MTESLFQASWDRCWRQLGAAGDGRELMQRLLAAYSEPQRNYHTLQHLSECLALFDRHRALATAPAEVEMALWFHDAIYDVKAGDNEARSAEWAHQALQQAGVAAPHIEKVVEHVMATRHAALPQGNDQQLLVDIDLAILGAARERFNEYEAQVRQEYGWVPAFLFRRKRREILAEFLARDPIYSTPALRAALEQQARLNLHESMQELG